MFLLVTVATVMAPLAVVATWARDEIVDTDRYLETVEPLGSSPAVLDAISARVTHEILTRIDIPDVTDQALRALARQKFVPERARPLLPALATPLSGAVEDFVSERVDRLVHSDEFGEVWIEANRAAHAQLVALLTGDGTDDVDVSDGAVRVSLAGLIDAAKQRLVDDGFALAGDIPTVNASFTLVASTDVVRAQRAVGWLEFSARALPVTCLALLAVALVIASNRRSTTLATGLSIAAAMLLLGIALNVLRQIYLDSVPTAVLPLDVAALVYDTLVRFLRTSVRVVAAIAYLCAPTGSGRRLRVVLASAVGRMRSVLTSAGVDVGPTREFLGRNRAMLRVAVCAIGAFAYLARDHPSGTYAVAVVVCVVVLIVVVEVIAVMPSTGDERAGEKSGTL